MVEIRLATPEDVPFLPNIEEAACQLFLQYEITADLPLYLTPLEDFYEAQKHGLLWVAAVDEKPIGFALVEMIGELPHLEELDVLPDYGRQGIGANLVRTICDWVCASGIPAVTLTTFRDIPWNAPFYQKLGFRILEVEELTPSQLQIVEEEERHGLKRELRVLMRYETGSV